MTQGNSLGGARIRTALLVDFENIFIGLQRLDPDAARRFATDLSRWTGWLEALNYPALGLAEPIHRNLLVRYCYLNPVASSRYRADFTHAGFQVVDCPPLTSAGKNSADIRIVIDVLDLLAHPVHFDEIILMSSDADYTPVMLRLRAHDRRTVIITSGPSAAAFRSACDHVVEVGTFIDVALAGATGTEQEPAGDPAPQPATAGQEELRARISRHVLDLMAGADRPVALASVAHWVRTGFGLEAGTDWVGTGSFKKLLAGLDLPGLRVSPVGPSYLYDPERHEAPPDPADEPVPGQPADPLADLVTRVCRVTDLPRLSATAYQVLFEELVAEVTDNGYKLTVTSRTVRDRCTARGQQISRNAVNFVLTGLAYIGHPPGPKDTPATVAEAFAEQVLTLCGNARLDLSPVETTLLQEWINSFRPPAQPEPVSPADTNLLET